MRPLFESGADQMPFCRRFAVVLPRRRHRCAVSSMSCCAAVVPLRCRRHTATPPSFCRGTYDADNVLSDGLPPNRPGRQRPSSRALALQFVHNLPKRVVLPIAARVLPSFQQFFPFPLLSVRYLGRTAEKMIRRCLVREKALKPCSSGRGRLVGSPGERRSFSIENRRKGARKPQKEGDTICKTGKRQRRGTDHPQNAERMRRVFFGPFL